MNPVELIQPRFSSPFAGMFTEYVEVNRAVGKKFNTDIVYLEQFDTWCRAFGIEEQRITKDIYGRWCEKRPNEKDTTFACRIRTFNRAVRYLHDEGLCDFVPGPAPRFRKDFVPYIFTQEEITRFFDVADHIKFRAVAPLAHEVWPLLFKVLYGCGLRKSEALKLRPRDVDLENGILTILNAKHNKDRLVPMSPSLTQLCRMYAATVLPEGSAYFFPAPDGGQLFPGTVYTRFRDILWKAGIPHGGSGKGPRVHDFRHTFSVRRLAEWTRAGVDIYVTIQILSVYLGHNDLSATQRYLRLTAEIFPEMTAMFENHFGDVFPEVPHEEV